VCQSLRRLVLSEGFEGAENASAAYLPRGSTLTAPGAAGTVNATRQREGNRRPGPGSGRRQRGEPGTRRPDGSLELTSAAEFETDEHLNLVCRRCEVEVGIEGRSDPVRPAHLWLDVQPLGACIETDSQRDAR